MTEEKKWVVHYGGIPIRLNSEQYAELVRLSWEDPAACETKCLQYLGVIKMTEENPDDFIEEELLRWRDLPVTKGELYDVLLRMAQATDADPKKEAHKLARSVRSKAIMDVGRTKDPNCLHENVIGTCKDCGAGNIQGIK